MVAAVGRIVRPRPSVPLMPFKQVPLWCLLSMLAIAGCDDATRGVDESDPLGPIAVRLVPMQVAYLVGDTIVAQVLVEDGENVGAIAFHLVYDEDVLHFVRPADEGPWMGADGTNTVFLAVEVASGGELVVGHSRLGNPIGASGSGLLATFEFFALSPGSGGFEFSAASVRDPQAYFLPAVFSAVQPVVQP